jgi:hypothetical protein
VAARNLPPLDSIRGLVGHRFPGGTYTIAHWENYLLTECTGSAPLPDGLAHPIAMFHVPILGAGTSIGEMFALGQADSNASIGIESYEWDFFEPLREEQAYRIDGTITEADRRESDGRVYDRIAFRFEMKHPAGHVAAVTTITWHYNRGRR